MIDKAQATVQTSVNIEVLFEIIRKESNVKPGYPFEARMGEDTKQRYKQTWQRIIGSSSSSKNGSKDSSSSTSTSRK
ncbi:DNA helicase RecQ [Botryosphaeria dothidea]|uniref:DNA helicase RecQ n=1 Tax=Botryosphaeria dothidea TaxID=55169 RepID=A0A8H4N9P8_9PEZI|nr:DNA helicase RecQ [Botryosphaeria dothidea]